MAIIRTPIIDDNGTGTTGTILNNAWKQELYGQIDGVSVGETLTVTTSGPVALSAAYSTHVIYLNPSAPIAITFAGGNGSDGERLILMAAPAPASVTTIAHGGAIHNQATSAPTPIAQGGSATYTRLSGGWYLTAYHQGKWISGPYLANAFGSSAGPWTVDAGDVVTMAYRLSGGTLEVSVMLASTSVPIACANLSVVSSVWGGFTIGGVTVTDAVGYANDGGTPVAAYVTANAGLTYLNFTKAAGNWIVSTNSTYLYGSITFPVA